MSDLDQDTSRVNQQKQTNLNNRLKNLQHYEAELYRQLTTVPLFVSIFQYLSFIVMIFVVPILVLLNEQMCAGCKHLISQQVDLLLPLFFLLIGFANIIYAREYTKNSLALHEIQRVLKREGVEPKFEIVGSKTQNHKVINRLQNTYILGTFIVVCLWYLNPDNTHFEPLAAIYGFGTALFGYYRTKFSVSNSFDNYVGIDQDDE